MKDVLLLFASILVAVVSGFGQETAPDRPAKMLSVPAVAYPQEAKEARIGGKVVVRVTVDASGSVTDAEFTSGPGFICRSVTSPPVVALREAAVAAALQATYSPAIKDGQPVISNVMMTFEFGEAPTKSETEARKPTTLTVIGEATDGQKTLSGGVLNGKALSLPKPSYPAAARAVRATGAVQVQVLIYEDGTVFSAYAVSGHPLLQAASVEAACGAKFTPVLLSGNPVKVSGIITYNFVP